AVSSLANIFVFPTNACLHSRRERAPRASWINLTRLWHQQITIGSERRVRTPARPGAKPVVKLAIHAGRSGRRGANQAPARSAGELDQPDPTLAPADHDRI
ncbi:MAG TPA: hypothetical protein VEX18_01270, partial [Polyangiaceae bacterium]|nr:hypothetical protein [Polyangiaceae bacterium]